MLLEVGRNDPADPKIIFRAQKQNDKLYISSKSKNNNFQWVDIENLYFEKLNEYTKSGESKMRDRVVNKTKCKPMVTVKDQS